MTDYVVHEQLALDKIHQLRFANGKELRRLERQFEKENKKVDAFWAARERKQQREKAKRAARKLGQEREKQVVCLTVCVCADVLRRASCKAGL